MKFTRLKALLKFNRIKALYALVTCDIAGIIKYVLTVFNEQVLGRIKDKDTGLKYVKDTQAVSACLRAILENHVNDMGQERKVALESIVAAVDSLANALEDFEVNMEELDMILARVNAAIDAWKKSK